MKKNIVNVIHAAVLALALVLITVSSSMAYPLSDLSTILILGSAAILLDAVMLFLCQKPGLARDLLTLATVVLCTLCLCYALVGRADLMGYVWFSDLEKGNPTAVTSLNLAAASMGCFLLCGLMNIVSGFRKNR